MAVAEAVTTDRTAWRTELYGVAHRTRNMCFVRKMTEGTEFFVFFRSLCFFGFAFELNEQGKRDEWWRLLQNREA